MRVASAGPRYRGMENAEVSPTAQVLGRLCAAYGLTMSRLIYMVESEGPTVLRLPRISSRFGMTARTGFTRRRSVASPRKALQAEVVQVRTEVWYHHHL